MSGEARCPVCGGPMDSDLICCENCSVADVLFARPFYATAPAEEPSAPRPRDESMVDYLARHKAQQAADASLGAALRRALATADGGSLVIEPACHPHEPAAYIAPPTGLAIPRFNDACAALATALSARREA